MAEEQAGHATHEGARDEHGAEHQADGDDRARNLVHRRDRRGARLQTRFDVMFHRLDDDDRVVHDNANGQHQAEKREVIQAEAKRSHHREGADNGHRHRNQRDDCRPPVL